MSLAVSKAMTLLASLEDIDTPRILTAKSSFLHLQGKLYLYVCHSELAVYLCTRQLCATVGRLFEWKYAIHWRKDLQNTAALYGAYSTGASTCINTPYLELHT